MSIGRLKFRPGGILLRWALTAWLLFTASPHSLQAQTTVPDGTYQYKDLPAKCSDTRDAVACIPNAVGIGGDATSSGTASSIAGPRCGDAVCNGAETSATCATDCPLPAATCGSANGTTITAYPSGSSACSSGVQAGSDTVGSDGTYNWSCTGGSVTAGCTANRRITGACGPTSGGVSTSYPTGAAACTTGNQITVDSAGADGRFDWTCNGLNGGATATCMADRVLDGACGSSAGTSTATYPTGIPACASGTQINDDSTATDGIFNWRCQGGTGGATPACTATKAAPTPVNGTCGASNGTNQSNHPTGLSACSSGTFSNTPDSSTTWFWSCLGSGGGTSTACSSNRPVNGLCGPADGVPATSHPGASSACSAGTFTDSPDTPSDFAWTCTGLNGGTSATCTAAIDAGGTDGTCGAAANQPTASAPTTGLCLSGSSTMTDATGSDGLYNWTCSATGSGTPSNCSAPRQNSALCGPANGTTTSTDPTSTACASGASVAGMQNGAQWTWSCISNTSPNPSAACAANKPTVNGICGTGNGTTADQQPFGASACVSGTFVDNPDAVGTWYWSCSGSGTGTSSSCSATQGAGSGAFIPAKIALSINNGCARMNNGSVRCWGDPTPGLRGTDLPPAPNPDNSTVVKNVSGVTAISAQENSFCVLINDGTVQCWGANDIGQLGNGGLGVTGLPNLVVGLSGLTATRIASQYQSSCVLANDSSLYCWGQRDVAEMNACTTDQVSATAAATGHPVASILTGNSTSRDIFYRSAAGDTYAFGPFNVACGVESAPAWAGATQMVRGTNHTCGLIGGNVFCNGATDFGATGSGVVAPGTQTLFQQVPGLSNVTSIAAGLNYTCALKADKSLWCWGGNAFGQLGIGSYNTAVANPTLVTGLPPVDEIVTSRTYHTCAYVSQGRNAYCWGSNVSNHALIKGAYPDRVNKPTLVTY